MGGLVPGGVCSRGSGPEGGSGLGWVSATGGGGLIRGGLVRGVVVSQHALRQTPPL